MTSDHETKLLDFFSSEKNYPYQPEFIRIVQTHISIVAIAPPFVFKAKKNIRLSFLDYSTPEKRAFYIQRELELNQRLCREIYLDKKPIYQQNGKLTFNESGEVYDYVLKMKYLDPDESLEKILLGNKYNIEIQDRIAERLHHFYANAMPVQSPVADLMTSLQEPIKKNISELAAYSGNILAAFVLNMLSYYTTIFLHEHADFLRQRIAGNYIRDCHGDLRLEHIYVSDDKICIYDCIEFNDEFRRIDIANDIAFLAMEMDSAGYADSGNLLVGKIFELLRDFDGNRLLNFYKVYRALVRTKVNCILAGEAEVAEEARQNSVISARRFLNLALRYASAGSLNLVLVVMGKTATGKSTISAKLAETLGCLSLSTDRLRKQMANIDPTQPTPENRKPEIYSTDFSQKVYSKMINTAAEIVQKTGAIVLDGTFSKKKYRELIKNQIAGGRIFFIELKSDEETLKIRLKNREITGDVSDARLKDKDLIDAMYESPSEISRDSVISLYNRDSFETVLENIFRKIIEINVANA